MNNLSTLIYLAGVSENVQGTLIAFSIFGFIAYGVWVFFAAMEGETKPPLSLVVWAAVFGAVASFLPSQNTVYLIAASEAGEAVAATPEAQAMLSDVREIIRRELGDILQEGGE